MVRCKIDDAAISTLADLLHSNTIIQELWLQGNNISQQGAHELSTALKCNTSLLTLSLLGCHSITELGALALTQSLHDNNSLNRLELPDKFQKIGEQETGYASIQPRLKWFADYTKKSEVNLSRKKVDCELLSESVIKLYIHFYTHHQKLLKAL